jgi:hypothetical protein
MIIPESFKGSSFGGVRYRLSKDSVSKQYAANIREEGNLPGQAF